MSRSVWTPLAPFLSRVLRTIERRQNLQVAGLAHYLKALHRTSQISLVRPNEGSALVTFWHEGMLALLAASLGNKDVGIYIRAQPQIQDTLELLAHLRIPTFVSDHRGTAGIKAARQWLSTPGRVLAVTADPVEPLKVVPGVARLARMLGVPLFPLAIAASQGYRMDRLDRCVVPHLGGKLTVTVLPRVNEPSVDTAAIAVQSALPTHTLVEPAHPPLVPWRRAFEPWPRLCLMPRTRGQLTLWPETQPMTISI